MEKTKFYVLPIAFMLTLAAPLTNDFFGWWEFDRKDENRKFAELPTIKLDYLDGFPKAYEAYYRDNFSFRTPLLNLYHKYKFLWVKVSPDPTKTTVGKDGWYFMAGKEKRIIEGKEDFTLAALDSFRAEWEYRLALMDSLGVKECHWLIAPIKHYVYSDKMEFNTVWSKKPRRVDLLTNYLNGHFPGLVIDPLEQLLAAKGPDNELYYKLDNHWSYEGSLVATQLLIEILKKQFPSLVIPRKEDYSWIDTAGASGFHQAVIGQDDLLEHYRLLVPKNVCYTEAPLYGFPPIPGFPYDYEKRYLHHQYSSLPRIVIIRDSFARTMIPFIRDRFGESVFIFDAWRYAANPKIIATIKPDIVIYCSAETHVDNLLKAYPEP